MRLIRGVAIVALVFAALTVLPVLLLRSLAPPTSAFMLEARLDALLHGDHGYRTRYEWVSLEQIAPHAALAVVASEDQEFPFHAGFDVRSIRQVIRASARGARLRGASTISQQVAKNLFLWNGRSYVRKGFEAWFTVLLEALWPKERILETYLNIAQFGRGIYGVQAAARAYFHEPASALTRQQAALLAAVLPNPLRLHADRPSRYVESRREWILEQMRRLGGPAYLKTVENETAASQCSECGGRSRPANSASTPPASKW